MRKIGTSLPNFPIKICAFCHRGQRLTYDPIKFEERFKEWVCPGCGVDNMTIWANENFSNSRERIQEILSHQTQVNFFITERVIQGSIIIS